MAALGQMAVAARSFKAECPCRKITICKPASNKPENRTYSRDALITNVMLFDYSQKKVGLFAFPHGP